MIEIIYPNNDRPERKPKSDLLTEVNAYLEAKIFLTLKFSPFKG